jgi:hypothetical protein
MESILYDFKEYLSTGDSGEPMKFWQKIDADIIKKFITDLNFKELPTYIIFTTIYGQIHKLVIFTNFGSYCLIDPENISVSNRYFHEITYSDLVECMKKSYTEPEEFSLENIIDCDPGYFDMDKFSDERERL